MIAMRLCEYPLCLDRRELPIVVPPWQIVVTIVGSDFVALLIVCRDLEVEVYCRH